MVVLPGWKHYICIALRYPPDWSCSERRIIYCEAAGAQCCHGVAERRRREQSRAAPAGPAKSRAARGKPKENTPKKPNKQKKITLIKIIKSFRPTVFYASITTNPRARYSGRTGSAPSPPLPFLSFPFHFSSTAVCVNCKISPGEAGEEPPAFPTGQAPGTPPV